MYRTSYLQKFSKNNVNTESPQINTDLVKKVCEFYSCDFTHNIDIEITENFNNFPLVLGSESNKVAFKSRKTNNEVTTTVYVTNDLNSQTNLYQGLALITKYFSKDKNKVFNDLNTLTPDETSQLLAEVINEQEI